MDNEELITEEVTTDATDHIAYEGDMVETDDIIEQEPIETELPEPIELEPSETDNKIYFDSSKTAHSSPIDNPLCKVELDEWRFYAMLALGKDYDVDENGIVDLRLAPEYIAQKFKNAKAKKHAENTQKAKQIIENGYVDFKGAQFETNAQTVGDLTATMLILQTSNVDFYNWLSKDDKVVELSLEDFVTLGGLIAEYKNNIWNTKYIAFKTAIEQAETIEELNAINIDYEVSE